ncbi:hypothetical protein WMF38_31330 [Sorangium sp. So ce118]
MLSDIGFLLSDIGFSVIHIGFWMSWLDRPMCSLDGSSGDVVAYGVAKAASEAKPALRTVTAPLAKIFATRRTRGGEEPPQPVVQPPQPPPGA